MGYCTLLANCGSCGKLFSSNPVKVPSLNNVPFCKSCIDRANPQRIAKGLKPITYAKDAYECCNEDEL